MGRRFFLILTVVLMLLALVAPASALAGVVGGGGKAYDGLNEMTFYISVKSDAEGTTGRFGAQFSGGLLDGCRIKADIGGKLEAIGKDSAEVFLRVTSSTDPLLVPLGSTQILQVSNSPEASVPMLYFPKSSWGLSDGPWQVDPGNIHITP